MSIYSLLFIINRRYDTITNIFSEIRLFVYFLLFIRSRRYDTITSTGLPCHREPSIVLMSMLQYSDNKKRTWIFLSFAAAIARLPGLASEELVSIFQQFGLAEGEAVSLAPVVKGKCSYEPHTRIMHFIP